MEKCFFYVWMSAIIIFTACNSSAKTFPNISAGNETPALPEDIANWTPLFDGKTFAEWHIYGKDSITNAWKVEDSMIHLTSAEKNGWQTKNGGDLVTNDEYDNFDLTLQWKISKGGNSGIFFYVNEDTTKFKNPNESGLEMQINDDANNKNGTIEKQKCGDLVGLLSSSSSDVLKPAGEWNEVEIRSDRGKLHFFVNGKQTLSTMLWNDSFKEMIDNSKFKKMNDYGTYRKGKIVLQDHGADVWFRNIRIKRL